LPVTRANDSKALAALFEPGQSVAIHPLARFFDHPPPLLHFSKKEKYNLTVKLRQVIARF